MSRIIQGNCGHQKESKVAHSCDDLTFCTLSVQDMYPASVQQDLYLQEHEGSLTKISHPSADTMSEVGAASVGDSLSQI